MSLNLFALHSFEEVKEMFGMHPLKNTADQNSELNLNKGENVQFVKKKNWVGDLDVNPPRLI